MYLFVATLLGAFLATWVYVKFIATPPTCADGEQNGLEVGVDCGGACLLLCPLQARPAVLQWARSFAVAPGTYTATAYLQNPNIGAGSKNVGYLFELYDQANNIVARRSGFIDIPPVQVVPVVEPNIVSSSSVVRTLFTLTDEPVWSKVLADTVPDLTVTGQNLSSDGTKLTATVENKSFKDVTRLQVVAVLFDTEGVAVASSESEIQTLGERSSQEIVFTWPRSIPSVAHAEITVLPSF